MFFRNVHLCSSAKTQTNNSITSPIRSLKRFSKELDQTLHSRVRLESKITQYSNHVSDLIKGFPCTTNETQGTARTGYKKTSFVYLLLDPRTRTHRDCKTLRITRSSWEWFLRSIFYVGKGSNNRPLKHFNDALRVRSSLSLINVDEHNNSILYTNPRINQILDIWSTGQGVVCLQVFRNIIPNDAFTREAAIIDALGLSNLTNARSGRYFGVASQWSMRKRRQLGVALLYNALAVMQADGECQLYPEDL